MKEDLISIVVPVYNVKIYLEECINSIIVQSYKNIEIILVDDGSTDESSKMCDEFAKKDNRIKVIHKKNGGLSDARNAGIDIAKGKYICFVDGDDYISKDYIESLYNNLKKYDVDISACGYLEEYDNGKIINRNKKNVKLNLNREDALKYLCIFGYYSNSACNKLFKIELFNDIRFPYGEIFEDNKTMYKIFDKIKKLYYNSEEKYYYRQRVGSITKKNNKNVEAINSIKIIYEFIEKKYPKLLPYAKQNIVFAYMGVYNSEIINAIEKQKLEKLYTDMKSYKMGITYNKLKFNKKIQLILFTNFRKIYDILYIKLKNRK